MNAPGFALPEPAYFNPIAYGADGPGDIVSWTINFIFFDGKMRGLFSLLFGASLLLITDAAEAKGERAARVHYSRMLWLAVFGSLHFYLIWWGDILSLYASLGMLAWFFHDQPPRALIRWGTALVLVQFLAFALLTLSFFEASAAALAPGADAAAVGDWTAMKAEFAVPDAAELARTMALYTGSYAGIVGFRLSEELFEPLTTLIFYGWETLGYMLLGMAALKTGFLTGEWSVASYRRVAAIGFAVTVPAYALLAWLLWQDGFSVQMLFALAMTVPILLRPVMVVAIAALVILITRGGGALVDWIAAAGRAAFTNYLGTSLLMTGLFYGYGLGFYGTLSRAELWLVVIAAWALMLLWSKPWLDRYLYGPFEWVWRSLARGKLQPVRRRSAAT
ncbi:MAG TPA: DUF418 domain-containing protein, partial [Allosphingosinicella sp.]